MDDNSPCICAQFEAQPITSMVSVESFASPIVNAGRGTTVQSGASAFPGA